MNDLYWITRLDSLNGVLLLFCLIATLYCIFYAGFMVANRLEYDSCSSTEFANLMDDRNVHKSGSVNHNKLTDGWNRHCAKMKKKRRKKRRKKTSHD